jgi:hypothetical protein
MLPGINSPMITSEEGSQMTDETLPTIAPCDKIQARLDYDQATGVFVWRYCEEMPENWNARWAGIVAGTDDRYGYRVIKIDGKRHFAHRVAWMIVTGEWPVDQIDHINGDTSDNRIANLRVVSRTENGRNAAIPSHNTSGHIGVYWHKRCGKWLAQIKVDGRDIHLGRFVAKADAIAARAAAEIIHGFHPNHGRTHHR